MQEFRNYYDFEKLKLIVNKNYDKNIDIFTQIQVEKNKENLYPKYFNNVNNEVTDLTQNYWHKTS